ncbi:MAG TPA: AAA-associated domain-containing protein [Streptosporangiaceae bacterium]|nr:AAA-associated domain-containing protein [Streptosporangiaceae bacterium]
MSIQAAPATPLIGVRSLSKSFSGPGGRPIPVLDNINLDVAEGEFVALLGRSGSGKSTLLRCIAGLMAPTSGEVLFRGRRLTGTNRETSMVFQTFALMPWLTVQQNVELGLEARGVPTDERTERALRAIDIVGLDGYESAYPKELSGGMRQRVGFARALVVEPAALLMDEPFSALDVLTSENLRGELLELWEGHRFPTKTIVMVTHNIEEAVLLADRILVLGTNPGRIRSDIVNPLPRPRRRRTPDFDELVDQIYRLMTKPDEQPAAVGGPGPATISDTPLPHATVDGLSGLAEILLAMHGGSADLADLAESLGLEVDDLLPLVDALVLLGFADLRDDRLELSDAGKVFAGASIQDSKQIFARACLQSAPLVRTIYRSLRGTADNSLPSGFFMDILRTSFGEEEAAQQLDVAVNWGRYAELYDYDAARGQIIREEQGIGATIADAPEPPRRGSLTVYLGAAPGVGKTYTMLREGRKLRDLGEDVVIGYADPRGREHTQEAIGGLEIVPPADGQMDVAAVLDRRPEVALVDDLGMHLAGVEALRSAGIHVISTADVAEVQRTAADVEAVTGTPPPATISDEVLASIDALQFVDSSPEALRKRLGHGNIYPLNRVDAALRAEFQPARLAALREIGLRLVGQSVPGSGLERGPQDVLAAVWRADQADSLVQRGVRLARRRGARCTVLALQHQIPQSPAALAFTERVEAAATVGGASVMLRESRDVGAAIISAVQELNARHLVLAVPTAGVFERWRGSLLERLAGQLPRVHLHIEASPGPQHDDARNGGAEAGGPPRRRRGAIRVYLGYAPGCGTTTAMLEEANRRHSRGSDVVVGAVDAPDREDIAAELEHLELIGDGTVLDTVAVLDRRPEVVCIDDLTAGTASAERRFAAARRLAEAGITVIGTVQLGELAGGGPAALLDEAGLLALADEIELVDVSPSILRDRVRRREIVPPDQLEGALATTFALPALAAERERAFRIVAEHGERQLAAYTGAPDDLANAGVPDTERRPSILACAAPLPGMERLIRRAAALAAQVDGDFRVAAVRLSEPGGGEDQLLAGYAALTEQLGGEFAVLIGPAPAPALAAYASQQRATELVLTRAQTNPVGRYPVLRELARLVHDAELHVLPVDR